MHRTTAEKINELSDPKERASLLEDVRLALRDWAYANLLPKKRNALYEQLQSPAMYLYERGSLEIVVHAIGDRAPSIDLRGLRVTIVHEQGTSDLNAGKVVWSIAAE